MADAHDITDEQLGAYADGELDDLTRMRVERALSADRAARARLAAIREVSMLVRAATRSIAEDAASAPPSAAPALPYRAERPRARPRAWLDWRFAAAFIGGLVVMGAILQVARIGPVEPPGWQRSALEFHGRYDRAIASNTRLALDHPAPSAQAFATEFARLVDFEPVLPDLSAQNYRPVGARLLATPDGPATFIVYEAENGPLIGYSMVQTGAPERDYLTTDNHLGISMVSWSDGRFEYGLSGQLSSDSLALLAETARNSVRDKTPPPGRPL